MINDTTLKQIAAVKAMVNKGNHIWRPSWSWLYLRGAFGQKFIVNFATSAEPAGATPQNGSSRLLSAPYYRAARSDLQMTG